ncbi:ABC transporter substrate-binding protein [Lonepinella sp. BR2357]|uniref:ABC transporter substrate-binding protein n=1 Tax=Lonepinella sp. BR2357 TaxID=3434549 RepID=UPI003F6E37D4
MKFRKTLLKLMLVLSTLFVVQAFQAAMATEEPYELTQKISDNLFKDIQSQHTEIKSNPNILKSIVHQDLMPYVNAWAEVVLSTHSETLHSMTLEKRQELNSAFEKYIETVFSYWIAAYNDSKSVEMLQPETLDQNEKYAMMSVMLTQKDQQQQILTFYWRKNSRINKWFIYDLKFFTGLHQVSPLEGMRAHNKEALDKGGVDALISHVLKFSKRTVDLKKYLELFKSGK